MLYAYLFPLRQMQNRSETFQWCKSFNQTFTSTSCGYLRNATRHGINPRCFGEARVAARCP